MQNAFGPLCRGELNLQNRNQFADCWACFRRSGGGPLLELAIDMSLTSLGSSHTLRLPQSNTDAASRFCRRKDTILGKPSRNHCYSSVAQWDDARAAHQGGGTIRRPLAEQALPASPDSELTDHSAVSGTSVTKIAQKRGEDEH